MLGDDSGFVHLERIRAQGMLAELGNVAKSCLVLAQFLEYADGGARGMV